MKCRSEKVSKRESGIVKNIYCVPFNIILIAVFFILPFLAPFVYADNGPEAVFKKANQLYEQGLYDEAIKEYTRLLDQGLESGNLYFNLGNSYFKKGELGKAILNYERAKRLDPDDSDLRSNYSYALSKMDNTPQPAASSFEKIAGIYSHLTIDGLAGFLSAVYFLIIVILTASTFIQRIQRFRIIAISILSVVLLSGVFSLYNRVSVLDKEAIVISKNANAKFEPLDNATTHFTLYEGMKVYVIESKEKWSKVQRSDGKTGWIMNSSIDRI